VGARLGAGPEEVVFFVRDRGPGISEGDQAHVFERKWRGSPRHGHGSGLGLAICKDIVEAHDSTLELESRVGQGATFSFTLWAAGVSSISAPSPAEMTAGPSAHDPGPGCPAPDVSSLPPRPDPAICLPLT
jgi:hypothetical protein